LVQTLKRPGLAQLRQRIGMVANLKPLDAAEVAEYIDHRLRMAGSNGKPVFTGEALKAIAERGEGTPRCINNLCFNALLLGYSMRQEIIDMDTVEKAAKKLDLEPLALSF
jgi:type II secretory pathway predicted ATPase ExeA